MFGNSDTPIFIGVDVGGTTTTAIVVAGKERVEGEVTIATDVSNPAGTINSIISAIMMALEKAGRKLAEVPAIGIGIPGKVDPDSGYVSLAVNLNWEGVPAGRLLESEVGVPCFLENDVRAAALGCYHSLAAPELKHLAYVSIGTGLAAGLILDGRLYRGAHGMAGEIGHVVVEPEGLPCKCGNRGCLEVYMSGPAVALAGRRAVEEGRQTSLADQPSITSVDIFVAAEAQDTVALEIIQKAGRYLGRALQNLMMTYDVEKIVLGGGVARNGRLLLRAVRETWQQQVAHSPLAAEMLRPDIVQLAAADANDGARGAVVLARERLEARALTSYQGTIGT